MINLATYEINCTFAKKVESDKMIVHECTSDKARFYGRAVSQVYCSRCNVRVPIYRDAEAVLERMPDVHQMTVDEWLKG